MIRTAGTVFCQMLSVSSWRIPLLALQGVLQGFAAWAEGCPCHVRSHTSAQLEMAASCPMRGKRARELASGALETVLNETAQMHLGTLLADQTQQEASYAPKVLEAIASDFV
eukprot:5593562-Amphidinium_carterae.1